MIRKKRGQISVEYLIVVSFVTFIVLTILGISLFYSTQIQDSIKFNQLERFAKKIISSAESTFYSGEPSRTTINSYLPEGVTRIEVIENNLVFHVDSAGGTSIIAYSSKVPIEINGAISTSSGLKKILIVAEDNKVKISGI
ncbi:hypothetical protein J4402_02820 [Candidatus Pacearchaeota archaeon]|nr:hypothetical protein [Candidatus Pacearchaeota archaeon]